MERYCAHCGRRVREEPGYFVEEEGSFWHFECHEDALADQAEDERLDDPRHEPGK